MNNLVAIYEENYLSYQKLTTQFQSMLSLLLQNQPLHIHSIIGRTKNKASLENKILQANDKYNRLSDITDICGIRIITYYEDEIDKISDFIRSHFSIDEENSVDKRKKLSPDRFGYLSLHLIVNLPLNKFGLGSVASDHTCKIEIQIRSILQHAWAEIEHDLEYKNPAGTSDETKRRFCRLASVLEFADREFKDIRNSIEMKNTVPALYKEHKKEPKSIRSFKLIQPGFFEQILIQFPNYGWAACASLIFFMFSILINMY